MEVSGYQEDTMTTRQCLLGGTSSLALIWYDWRQPQYVYVRPVCHGELQDECLGVLTHGVWREHDGLLCLAPSLEEAWAAARSWAESWHTLVFAH